MWTNNLTHQCDRFQNFDRHQASGSGPIFAKSRSLLEAFHLKPGRVIRWSFLWRVLQFRFYPFKCSAEVDAKPLENISSKADKNDGKPCRQPKPTIDGCRKQWIRQTYTNANGIKELTSRYSSLTTVSSCTFLATRSLVTWATFARRSRNACRKLGTWSSTWKWKRRITSDCLSRGSNSCTRMELGTEK